MPTYRMIFLGNLADMDEVETDRYGRPDYDAERAESILSDQTFGSTSSPLYESVRNVSLNETTGDGRIELNNAPGAQETVSYNLDGTDYEDEIDSTIRVRNVEITRLLPDGRTDTVTTTLRIFQDVNGNTFLMPPPLSGGEPGEVAGVTDYPIISIHLPDNSRDYITRYDAVYSDRYNVASFVPCFTAGTIIDTQDGPRRVEDLAVGDMVWTRDNGFQPIRWCGARRLSRDELSTNPRLSPVRIRAGALGPNSPTADLIVSPQHRILVRSKIAQRMFDASELLVAAVQLTEIDGIDRLTDLDSVTYVHLLFDRHEVLMSNGAETESLYPGPQAMEALGEAAQEIYALFPELREHEDSFPGARPFATGKRARQLAMRHAANARPLAG